MTRAEIIAQLDAELYRLERARDYLAAALKGSKTRFLDKLDKLDRIDIKLPQRPRKQRSKPVEAANPAPQSAPTVAAPVIAITVDPQVRRMPPRRRVERRSLQPDKAVKSTAALSGAVPAGPVVVSANEARKHERPATAPAALPLVSELRSEIGAERSLGSLIQAFERQTGFNGAETP